MTAIFNKNKGDIRPYKMVRLTDLEAVVKIGIYSTGSTLLSGLAKLSWSTHHDSSLRIEVCDLVKGEDNIHHIDIIVDTACLQTISGMKHERVVYPEKFHLLVGGAWDDWRLRAKALEVGADFVLPATSTLPELVAVVRSLARRVKAWRPSSNRYWKCDAETRWLIGPSGKTYVLTRREVLIVKKLAQAFPRPCSRQDLCDAIANVDYEDFDDRILETAMSRLRKKLQEESGNEIIRAARLSGYFFAEKIVVQ